MKNSNNKINIINYFSLNQNDNNDFLIENYNNNRSKIYMLFKIFISIFYYENEAKFNIYNTLKLHENYYLINPDWINKFKKNYNYEELYESLYLFYQKNTHISYSNLDRYIDKIIKFFINENIFIFEKLEFSQDLENTPIQKKSQKYYILRANILHLINEFSNLNCNLEPKMLLSFYN